jgi:predicted ribosome quality control (RQC) complex YloA/Tae2 family protein
MDQVLIQRVVEELRSALTGRFFGKIFQLTPLSFVFDFGLRGEFLLISADPVSPRLYLIRRRLRDLEKQSVPLTSFGQVLRLKLSGEHLISISKDPLDRIVRLTFRIEDEVNGTVFRRLLVQLTGRTANLFLLDELNRTLAILREQPLLTLHERYESPSRPRRESPATLTLGPESPSAQLDAHFSALDKAKQFDS